MRKNTVDANRRQALKLMLGGAAIVPLSALVVNRPAAATDLPHVTEDDPIAVSLKYKHDATQAPRVDKGGTPAAEQLCSNCQLGQGEGEWLSCSIFPGKAVNANGWCTAWVPRA